MVACEVDVGFSKARFLYEGGEPGAENEGDGDRDGFRSGAPIDLVRKASQSIDRLSQSDESSEDPINLLYFSYSERVSLLLLSPVLSVSDDTILVFGDSFSVGLLV